MQHREPEQNTKGVINCILKLQKTTKVFMFRWMKIHLWTLSNSFWMVIKQIFEAGLKISCTSWNHVKMENCYFGEFKSSTMFWVMGSVLRSFHCHLFHDNKSNNNGNVFHHGDSFVPSYALTLKWIWTLEFGYILILIPVIMWFTVHRENCSWNKKKNPKQNKRPPAGMHQDRKLNISAFS